jgi:hypothetical protein
MMYRFHDLACVNALSHFEDEGCTGKAPTPQLSPRSNLHASIDASIRRKDGLEY